jgi:hypothetical protein
LFPVRVIRDLGAWLGGSDFVRRDRLRTVMTTMKEETLMKKLALATAAYLLVAMTLAAAAQGGPDGANLQLHLFDCTGPVGTPSSFDVEFQHAGAAWHLTDSQQIFEALIGFDETANTEVVVTPGFNVNAVPAVTCRFVGQNGHVFRVTGILTPAARG